MTRAGWALRQGWAIEAAGERSEKRWPGYHERHQQAWKLMGEISRAYGEHLLATMPAEDAMRVLMREQGDRYLVAEADGQFIVTVDGQAVERQTVEAVLAALVTCPLCGIAVKEHPWPSTYAQVDGRSRTVNCAFHETDL